MMDPQKLGSSIAQGGAGLFSANRVKSEQARDALYVEFVEGAKLGERLSQRTRIVPAPIAGPKTRKIDRY